MLHNGVHAFEQLRCAERGDEAKQHNWTLPLVRMLE